MIPGRMRTGWVPWAANAAAFALLAAGTQVLARQSAPWDPAAWAAPATLDVILAVASLLFLGLSFVIPLHSGVLNLGLYAQFLAGLLAASFVGTAGFLDPGARAGAAAVAGAVAGGLTGALLSSLKRRFAVHEVLSGLLLGGALALAAPAPGSGPGLASGAAIGGGVFVLAMGILLAFAFAQVLRGSVPGFDLRIVGSNPLAAVAAGVDVDGAQLRMLVVGGGCAGLAGALQLWTNSGSPLERWPMPLAFAGLTVAFYGVGRMRGLLAAAILLGAWIAAPGTAVPLGHPGWGAAVAALLLAPGLWVLPRVLPDQGAPRALWRTRHRETY